MSDIWTERWNERFKQEAYAYGEEPNRYLKEKLVGLAPGAILFPAEGEGRNAVYAASLSWKVSAFDISNAGRDKALRLAADRHVTIDYRVSDVAALPYDLEQFDAMALIYAHFPAAVKSAYHRTLDRYVRKGGYVILEAFSKNHLSYIERDEKVGGPKDIDMLFSIEELKADFANYELIELTEKEIELNEGLFHNGKGSVIRLTGRKR